MNSYVDHVAFNVENIDWYSNIFREVFGMNIKKTVGESPNRKVWFVGGIQLNECTNDIKDKRFDHVAIVVDNIEKAIELLYQRGCMISGRGRNWIQLPNKVLIELLEE